MKLLEKPHQRDDLVMIAIEKGDASSLDELPRYVAHALARWERHSIEDDVVYYEHAGMATTNSPYTRLTSD